MLFISVSWLIVLPLICLGVEMSDNRKIKTNAILDTQIRSLKDTFQKISKDTSDKVRRNPYSINITTFTHLHYVY